VVKRQQRNENLCFTRCSVGCLRAAEMGDLSHPITKEEAVYILNDPSPCIEKLETKSNPADARKCMRVYHTHRIPPTCFGHSCGHLQGGALHRIETWKV